MRVIAIHLLNDYSGSPKILKQLLNIWIKNNIESHLFLSGGREGFLTAIPKVQEHFYWYVFVKNPFLRLFFLVVSQIVLFFKLLFFLRKGDVIYVNTVLPFGAGIIGKMKKCKVIYHIHETSVKPKILKRFLFGVVEWSASEVVFVSKFSANQETLNVVKRVVYNVLEYDFVVESQRFLKNKKVTDIQIVLMICSLKEYKGVYEFVKLAKLNLEFDFKLVVNATQEDIDRFFGAKQLASNLQIYPTSKEPSIYYKEASVLLNLSNPERWIETFGLTVLEAMAYGLPAIVPRVGGLVELVEDGVNGYLIDCKNLDLISCRLNELFQDTDLYNRMSVNALSKSALFREKDFEMATLNILFDNEVAD
jgi:glycosyltransferase involved in cell wall biosynthesis